ncbi:MAG: hypothetical protein ABIQ35_00965 [Verrucomicrobiota bacterium]
MVNSSNSGLFLKFLVRKEGGMAVKFRREDEKKLVTAVPDSEASVFEERWQAELKAVEHGLRHGSFMVEALKPRDSDS